MEQQTWEFDDAGMVKQSLFDMQDSDIRLFTETAANHNQAIQDGKEDLNGH